MTLDKKNVRSPWLRAFTLGFGLLPLWVSTIWVFVESLGAPESYWITAPWIIVFSIPVCGITLAIARITGAVYRWTDGDRGRKLKRAVACFSVLTFIAVIAAGAYWNRQTTKRADLAGEKEAGRTFVQRSKDLASRIPGKVWVTEGSMVVDRRGVPIRYKYYVRAEGNPTAAVLIAIVEITRDSGAAMFHLACIISIEEYRNRELGADPCAGRRVE